jgi:hypothetical protein
LVTIYLKKGFQIKRGGSGIDETTSSASILGATVAHPTGGREGKIDRTCTHELAAYAQGLNAAGNINDPQ